MGTGRLAKELATLRAHRGLTQRQAANEIGCSLRQYQRWEKGQSLPTPNHVDDIARVFDVPTSQLVSAGSTDILERLDGIELAILERLGNIERTAEALEGHVAAIVRLIQAR